LFHYLFDPSGASDPFQACTIFGRRLRMRSSLHIGTSGWTYRHWKETFYPAELKQADWLEFYASHFDTTEINYSFYHLPKPETVKKWAEKVPDTFRFSAKLSRGITHFSKLNDCSVQLEKFFNSFSHMGKKLGLILIQLPPSLHFDPERIEKFFDDLAPYSQFEFALEARHASWYLPESLATMQQHKIANVISDSNGRFPYSDAVTAHNVYIRFHGPAALYSSGYSDEQLSEYATTIQGWMAEGRTVWAYFNNDNGGFALKDARTLKQLVHRKH